MARIEKTIEIKAPVEKVYACCSDAEGYSRFMEGVKEIKMTGDKTSHWKMEALGRTMEFDSEMTEIIENKRIAWKSIGDIKSEGSWDLEPTSEGTKATYVMDYEIPGIVGAIIDRIKVSKEMEKSIEKSLHSLKANLEGK
ncbi:MAG: SRPBCC family protein [Candidatus Methanofastidiosia archaeon]